MATEKKSPWPKFITALTFYLLFLYGVKSCMGGGEA